jgi:hypothetical protein
LSDTRSRVKILHAAHGALMCIVGCKIAKQPETIQLAILKKHYELTCVILLTLLVVPNLMAIHRHPHPIKNDQSPLPVSKPGKPAVKPQLITAKDMQSFQIPDNVLGKNFIFSPDTEASGMYEVVGYYRGKDTVEYDIVFEDCGDPIRVDAEEMMGMLKDSLYEPV